MRPQGLDRSHRVRRRADFQRAYDSGRKIVRKAFVVFVMPNGLPESRLGVTATRKTGNAVTRNRARRKVREAFRKHHEQWPAGHDYVVVVRPALLKTPAATLEAELLGALARTEGQQR